MRAASAVASLLLAPALLASCGGGDGAGEPPAPAAGLAITSTTLARVALAWVDGSSDESGFAVERSAAGGPFVEIGRVGADVTSYEDATIVPDQDYAYRVLSYGPGGTAAPSNEATTGTWRLVTLEARMRQGLLALRGDELAPASFTGSELGVDYTVEVLGFALCAPPSPFAPPTPGDPTPPATLYGCDNDLAVSLLPAGDALAVTIDVPALYVDLSIRSSVTGTDPAYLLYSDLRLTAQVALATTPDGRKRLVEPVTTPGLTSSALEFHCQDPLVQSLGPFLVGIAASQIEAAVLDLAVQEVAASLPAVPPYVP